MPRAERKHVCPKCKTELEIDIREKKDWFKETQAEWKSVFGSDISNAQIGLLLKKGFRSTAVLSKWIKMQRYKKVSNPYGAATDQTKRLHELDKIADRAFGKFKAPEVMGEILKRMADKTGGPDK